MLGIPLYLDASWLIILALLTWVLASVFPKLMHEQFPAQADRLSRADYWLMGLVTAIVFFACIILHELGHAMVARSRGMSIRGITLFLFGGVAEIEDEPPSPATEFLMAIAGPLVSVVLAVLFAFLAGIGHANNWPAFVVIILAYLASINGLIAVFNMLPAFPLDGGRVLRSILWATMGRLGSATWWASKIGQVFAWLLIFGGLVLLLYGDWGGLWLGLIGWFLNRAAQGSYQQVLIKQALEGEPVRRFMDPNPVSVPPSLDLSHWVDDYVYRYHRKVFPVADNDHLEGWISTQDLDRYPRQEWNRHTVHEVMHANIASLTIAPDADALAAMTRMQRTGANGLLVAEGDHLVGTVSLGDLLRYLHLKMELDDTNGGPRQGPPEDFGASSRPD